MPATAESKTKQRPFPRDCPNCRRKEVVLAIVPYSLQVKYEGKLYTVDIPALETPRCKSCEQVVFGVSVEKQINTAERTLLRLLQPAEIREGRERLGLSRDELSDRLGVSEPVLADWEDDISIQPRTADKLLRMFFAFPEVRRALDGKNHDVGIGVLVRIMSIEGRQAAMAAGLVVFLIWAKRSGGWPFGASDSVNGDSIS